MSPVQAPLVGAGPEQALRAGAGPVQAVVAAAAGSGPVQAPSSSGADLVNDAAVPGPGPASSSSGADHFADASGLEQALRAVAEISSASAADCVSVENAFQRRAAEVSEALLGGERSEATLHNPWNLFQHEHRGKGWSPAKMASMYKTWRASSKDKMP